MQAAQPAPSPSPSHLRSRAVALVLWLAALLLGGVYACSLQQEAAVDTAGVSTVVRTQLQALAAEDAGKAYALGDSHLRTRYANAEEFLDAVRSQYPMVLKPASVLFLQPEATDTLAMQKVRVTDGEGYGWLLTYVLHREGQQWLIRNCLVEPDRPQVMA